MKAPRVFLLEFNELCPTLLDRFMAEGRLPNFQKLYETSVICTTTAEEAPPNLEPWIQWPSVHSGMPFAEHQVFHLGDGRHMKEKCVGEVLSDAGVRVGICGSMNVNYSQVNGYCLPDPWDENGAATPEWLGTFHRAVAHQVQESSRESGGSRMELVRLAWFLLTHGITPGTVSKIATQLLSERVNSGVRWRRACLLDRLLYDVFRRLNRLFDVQFATFFCNSTAHFQHYYWRHMEPERFEAGVPEEDSVSLRHAIQYGYQCMDQLIGRFLTDYPDAVLMLCSALSQQPWTDTTKCTYRPRQFEKLLEHVGVPTTGIKIKPVMAEEFHCECADESTALLVEARFRMFHVDGKPLMKVTRTGNSLFAGCAITAADALDRSIARAGEHAPRAFRDLFYMVHTMRSGKHHPDGVLWIRNGRHQMVREKVPLTRIAPTILARFGVQPPAHMRGLPLFANSGERHDVSRTMPLATVA
ncbi:MAG: hypothetical protein K2R98_33815 [Gemmataceae bacterium]|nr:hypothetical protein [Gemmataceae bacterium]